MTKKELIKRIAEVTEGGTQKEAEAYFDSLCDVIFEEMLNEGVVTLPRIGTFSVVDVKARTGKIRLGEEAGKEWTKPAHKEPRFKESKKFKDCLM